MRALNITLVAFGLLLGLSIIRSVRRSHIRVEYSMIWIFTAAAIVLLASWPTLTRYVAAVLNIGEEPALILIGFGILTFVLYRLSLVISRLRDDNIVLVQRIAMLEHELRNPAEGGPARANRYQ